MSTFNPTVENAAQRWQAASLMHTLTWRLRAIWRAMERAGQRRAAPELRKLARQMTADGHEAGPELLRTAERWSRS